MSHTPDEPYRGSFPNPGGFDDGLGNAKRQQSLGQLIADTPRLFIGLAKDELEQAKRELTAKGKKLGVGVGLLAGAAFFALTMWACLVAAAIMGLAVVVPGWLAALIVAGAFLIITAILALVGIASIKRGTPIAPERTQASVAQDLNALKGTGQYE